MVVAIRGPRRFLCALGVFYIIVASLRSTAQSSRYIEPENGALGIRPRLGEDDMTQPNSERADASSQSTRSPGPALRSTPAGRGAWTLSQKRDKSEVPSRPLSPGYRKVRAPVMDRRFHPISYVTVPTLVFGLCLYRSSIAIDNRECSCHLQHASTRCRQYLAPSQVNVCRVLCVDPRCWLWRRDHGEAVS